MSRSVLLRLLIAGLLAVGFVIACGGGGGDGDGDDIAILDEYLYDLSIPEGTIYAAFNLESNAYTISVTEGGGSLRGTFNTDTGVITITGGDIDVNSALGDTLFGEFNVAVAETVTISDEDFPISGEVWVRSSIGDTTSRIIITYNPNVEDSGFDGVDLLYTPNQTEPGTSESSSYTWEAFEDLLGSEKAELWEQKASFAFNLLIFIYDQMEHVIAAFEFIDDNEDLLLTVNPITESCDAFSAVELTAPEGIDDQGIADFGWEDDGEVGPGDNFSLFFTDCWINDPEDDYDDLLQGGIDFKGYIENIETVDDVETLTGIGFEEVEFVDLVLAETSTEGDTCTLEPGVTTITGTFGIWFYAEP